MNISITFDVEIWCDGWKNLDAEFPAAFRRYIYGAGRDGYALPKTLEILNENHLKGVFFVEPLFAYRFGLEPLKQIVDLISDADQEVQLHLHPEWVDETDPPLIAGATKKRPHLHQYSLQEQSTLIAKAIEALEQCGAPRPTAFRAGNYACDLNTMRSLASNGILVDSSVNVTSSNTKVGATFGDRNLQPWYLDGVLEYPVTVFRDGIGRPRHWQVGATGYRESTALIRKAQEFGYQHLVLVSHSFELLTPDSAKPDRIAVSRFSKLCRWLDRNRNEFPTAGFALTAPEHQAPKASLSVPPVPTLSRLSAQAIRRIIAKTSRGKANDWSQG